MTPIDQIVQLVQLSARVYHHARVCGAWQLNAHELGATCFHIATQNGFVLEVEGHGEWQVNKGDLVIFPFELPHTMRPSYSAEGEQRHMAIGQAQHVLGTSMLCGQVQFRHKIKDMLLNALPPVLVIRKTDQTPWLCQMLLLLEQESLASMEALVDDRPITTSMLDRLSGLLFAYALRHQLSKQSPKEGVFALYQSPKLMKAVNAMHAAPEKAWSLDTLAQQALMSRTQFARQFKAISQFTPMAYLTWWRMQVAWSCLEKGDEIPDVAANAGYASDAAFARVFSKEFGVGPGRVRRLNSGK